MLHLHVLYSPYVQAVGSRYSLLASKYFGLDGINEYCLNESFIIEIKIRKGG